VVVAGEVNVCIQGMLIPLPWKRRDMYLRDFF